MKKYKGFSVAGAIGIIAVVAFLIIAGFLVIDGNNKATNYNDYDFYSVIEPDEHNGYIGDNVKGDPQAPVLIFEYADFQCPGCASINPRVNSAIEKADGKLAIVYRNFILSYHQNGTAAASAAQAAGLQGYYRAYADKLFSEQAEWEYASASERTALFQKYFTEVSNGEGDLEKFNSDLSSENVSKKISFDMGIAKRVDIASTPAFYIDDQLIDWSNREGGSITINNQTITWETNLTGEQFEDLLIRIAKAKLGEDISE